MKLSLMPTHLIYLVGNSEDLYSRKKEGSFDLHQNKFFFYDQLFDNFKINKIKINTIKNPPDKCVNEIVLNILNNTNYDCKK